MRYFIFLSLCPLLLFPNISSASLDATIAKSEAAPELFPQERLLIEGFGKSSLAVATINYEHGFNNLYSIGLGLGFNPKESLKSGIFYKTGVLTLPVYLVVTPWSGQLRPFLTGGFNFQFGLGRNNKKEPDRTFVQEWMNRSNSDFGRILDQGPALMSGIGLEYKFVGDWLIRATGYGLYFMQSETFTPWAGFSIGKQF